MRNWRVFGQSKLAVGGAAYLIFLLLFAIFVPGLLPYGYDDCDFTQIAHSPSKQHLLGTDSLGRDILARLAYGARISLLAGIFAGSVILFIGVPLGLAAGYIGGWVDRVIMQLVDTLWVIPRPMLMVAVMVFISGWIEHWTTGLLSALASIYDASEGLVAVFIGFAVGWWVGDCRVVRGLVVSLREKEFILAGRAVGGSDGHIMLRHILPNALSTVVTSLALSVPEAIVAEASLSFLGLGVKPPVPSWGAMILEGTAYLLGAPHILIFPALALIATAIFLNFFAEGLRDARIQ